MDNLRGQFPDHGGSDYDAYDRGYPDDDAGHDVPPAAIGKDERRMQVRAYNFWAGLLDNRNFPTVEDIDPEALPDFGPYSVLLDFTAGIENPAVTFLGEKLAEECGGSGPIERLADVPSRSLLSRITDHYMQILANQAPIGFEAEFVNQRGATILYRGILLPFSSDDETIDFIYGVINWKELADQRATDELMLEIDQALQPAHDAALEPEPLTDWADGPADHSGVLDLLPAAALDDGMQGPLADWPAPAFGHEMEEPEPAPPITVEDAAGIGLADWLASARDLAQAARGSEDRSRMALYAAIGRAHDFALAAAQAPADYRELLADAGLAVQERAPFTPLVKLVFGVDYDKTRITEYATVLGHARRVGLGRGELAAFLLDAEGGLKGVVSAERKLRREEAGKPASSRAAPRNAIAAKLRKLGHTPLEDVPHEGSEFTLLVARRLDSGDVVVLGEVADDAALLERAARHLID